MPSAVANDVRHTVDSTEILCNRGRANRQWAQDTDTECKSAAQSLLIASFLKSFPWVISTRAQRVAKMPHMPGRRADVCYSRSCQVAAWACWLQRARRPGAAPHAAARDAPCSHAYGRAATPLPPAAQRLAGPDSYARFNHFCK